jgi:hypothetical protein
MITHIEVKSNVARALRTIHSRATKESFESTGTEFHTKLRDRRFTNAHASAAGYEPRKGEKGSGLSFARSYTGRKLKKFGHTRPLEFTGETRRAVTLATIRSSSKGVKVAYPGARKFNYRSATSNIRMADEFRRVIPSEVTLLADHFRTQLAARFKEKQNESL